MGLIDWCKWRLRAWWCGVQPLFALHPSWEFIRLMEAHAKAVRRANKES